MRKDLLLACLLSGVGMLAQEPADVSQLRWMAGHWSAPVGRAVSEESWTGPEGGAMLGVSKTIARDRVVAFEYLRIEKRPDGIYYVAQPGGRPPTAFKLTKSTPVSAVFENPAHDHPKIITYRLENNSLIASIEGDEGGQHKKMEFRFRRKAANDTEGPESKRIDEVFGAFDKPGSPGCSVGVLKDGKFVHRRGYGYANLDYGVPLSAETVFDIGSTSKQFTAMTMLLLERDGKLSLDDEVRKHIPELPDYGKPLTIRHMLNHTSGLRDYLTLAVLEGRSDDDFYTDAEVVQMIARQKKLNFAPGEEFLYSNSGYFLVSQIVLRITGKSMAEFAEERIFKPLGMTGTHFHNNHRRIVAKRATGYSPGALGGYDIDMSTLDMIGDGGVYTSVDDLSRWDAAFYSPPEGWAPLFEKLQQPGVLNNGKTLDYALGLMRMGTGPLRVVTHSGAWAGFRSDLIRIPEQRFTVITLCNRADANPMPKSMTVARLFYPDLGGPGSRPPGAAPPKPEPFQGPGEDRLRSLAGDYRSDEIEATYRLRLEQGRLMLEVVGGHQRPRVLSAVADNEFRTGPIRLKVTGDSFVLEAGRVTGLSFRRIR